MIHGVKTRKLKVHCDERGRLMEMLRRDDPEMDVTFGQVYMTTAWPGVTKAWHYHRHQTDHFVCVKGMMKVVLYDAREDSPTKGEINEFFLGDHNPLIVEIPPLVYHGFKCIGDSEAIVVNTTTNTYNYANPDEFRVAPHDGTIPYDWARKDG
ncbi:MAG: dTDP-4-dehydrorhamnose 3,5-epimerase family protein [Candidatus Sumerlaeia bacterium]|nr:dTDP-4-dehydrorhamnose 3,5-epimerase family protein [Candidatus Sumerlaeia bacterium]